MNKKGYGKVDNSDRHFHFKCAVKHCIMFYPFGKGMCEQCEWHMTITLGAVKYF